MIQFTGYQGSPKRKKSRALTFKKDYDEWKSHSAKASASGDHTKENNLCLWALSAAVVLLFILFHFSRGSGSEVGSRGLFQGIIGHVTGNVSDNPKESSCIKKIIGVSCGLTAASFLYSKIWDQDGETGLLSWSSNTKSFAAKHWKPIMLCFGGIFYWMYNKYGYWMYNKYFGDGTIMMPRQFTVSSDSSGYNTSGPFDPQKHDMGALYASIEKKAKKKKAKKKSPEELAKDLADPEAQKMFLEASKIHNDLTSEVPFKEFTQAWKGIFTKTREEQLFRRIKNVEEESFTKKLNTALDAAQKKRIKKNKLNEGKAGLSKMTKNALAEGVLHTAAHCATLGYVSGWNAAGLAVGTVFANPVTFFVSSFLYGSYRFWRRKNRLRERDLTKYYGWSRTILNNPKLYPYYKHRDMFKKKHRIIATVKNGVTGFWRSKDSHFDKCGSLTETFYIPDNTKVWVLCKKERVTGQRLFGLVSTWKMTVVWNNEYQYIGTNTDIITAWSKITPTTRLQPGNKPVVKLVKCHEGFYDFAKLNGKNGGDTAFKGYEGESVWDGLKNKFENSAKEQVIEKSDLRLWQVTFDGAPLDETFVVSEKDLEHCGVDSVAKIPDVHSELVGNVKKSNLEFQGVRDSDFIPRYGELYRHCKPDGRDCRRKGWRKWFRIPRMGLFGRSWRGCRYCQWNDRG